MLRRGGMAGNNHSNGTRAYERIQQSVLKQIRSHQMKPGDPAASERELARLHGVSPITARHALSLLEREGVVEPRPVAGRFVAPPTIHINKLISHSEPMLTSSFAHCTKITPTT